MTTCGSSCVAAVARLLITSGMRSGDITETMLVRWRKAASTVAACDVIIGEPSSVHLGASDRGGEIADVARRCRRSRAAAPARARRRPPSGRRRSTCTIECQRSSRLAGSATVALFAREQLLVVDLLDGDRGVRRRPPRSAPGRRGGGARAASSVSMRSSAWSASGGTSPTKVRREQVAIVQQRRGLGDAGLARRRPRRLRSSACRA